MIKKSTYKLSLDRPVIYNIKVLGVLDESWLDWADMTITAGIPDGYVVTGTATDPAGSTSEFSECQAAVVNPPPVTDLNYQWHYDYDPLYRLTYACTEWDAVNEMCLGDTFEYTYDAGGNRKSQTVGGVTTNYEYDEANRLTSVDGVTYIWDNNGNLLNDGVNTYTYDYANRLVGLTDGVNTYSYVYNGLGDRLQQTVNGQTTTYTLDLNADLTQVLGDGTTWYLYGLGRVGEYGAGWEYYLTDALGSVRQLSDGAGAVTMTQSYEPFGDVMESYGVGESEIGFTGEQTDSSGLQYLRARYYNTGIGRFLTRDTWGGDFRSPLSLNRWAYVQGNPVNFTDPSGHMVCPCGRDPEGGCRPCPGGPIIGTTEYPPLGGADVAPWLLLLLATSCYYLANEAIEDFDLDIDQENGWEFYYIELGDYPSSELSSYLTIYQSLTSIMFIPGVDDMVKEIERTYQSVYSRGSLWKEPIYFGRVFEAERALLYYFKSLLFEVGPSSHAYDLILNVEDKLWWVEVKWSESGNTVKHRDIKTSVNQAEAAGIPSRRFILETTQMSSRSKGWLDDHGGLELPEVFFYN